jgi:hypothetical protein
MNTAQQARALGLKVGDTIEGEEFGRVARLKLLYLGSECCVWDVWEKDETDTDFAYQGEESQWTLSCRDWRKTNDSKRI